jgi:hypothetical protein
MEGRKIKFFNQDDYHHHGGGVLDFDLHGQNGVFLSFGTDSNSEGPVTIAIVHDDNGVVYYIHPEWMKFIDSNKEYISLKINEIIDEYVPKALLIDAKAEVNTILKRYL